MNRRNKLIVIGVVVALVVAVAGVVGAKLLKQQLNTITVTAQFDNTAGLFVTNNVTVLGMPVGRVTRVTPKTGYVEVEFTVDRNVKIPADAKAVTLSVSILTDRMIELSPPYRGGPTLKNGDTIGLTRTRTPIEFGRTLDMIDRLSKSLQGDGQGNGSVRTLLDSSAAVVDGNGEKMKNALSELSRAMRLSSNDGVQTREQLTTVITNLSALFDAAARNDASLREFGSTIRQLSQVVADQDLGSGTTGRQLNLMMTQLGELLESNRDAIKDVVANGDVTLKTMVDHQRDLAETLDVTPLTLDNIYNVVDQKNGAFRVHILTDKLLFDTQTVKEMCNILRLRQLGCSTGTLQDFGPDFGLSYILDGMAAMGQR